MNEKLYDVVATLTDEERRRDLGAFFTGRYDQELYADFASLRRERTKADAGIEGWVDALDAARLEVLLAYRTFAGRENEHLLWWALTHFFNHQTHHRGQVTTLLNQLGRDSGVTDFLALLRDEP